MKRVLVVRAGALGDTLMATPVARALHERGASVDFLCSEAAAPLLAANPNISRVIPLRQRNVPWFLSPEKRRLARELRAARYDFAVLLESAPRYRTLLERAGIGAIRSFRETPFRPESHSIANNLAAAGFPEAAQNMELQITPDDERAATRLLESAPRPLVGLHAGYGPRGGKEQQGERLRGWGAGNFVVLANLLAARGAHIVLTGSPEDRAEADVIAARLPPATCRQLAGRTSVRELAAVIRQLDAYVSVDSGPAHIAAAIGTPLVVIWGPGIYEQTRPISSTTPITVVRHSVFCAPCYGTRRMKACTRNICMEAISPQRVAELVKLERRE